MSGSATTALDGADGFANIIVANNIVANILDGRMTVGLRKAGGNWVEGDRFFDREAEIEALMERVEDGTHTLVTAQRRMGKTSLVRELLRRLREDGTSGLVEDWWRARQARGFVLFSKRLA